MLRTERLILRAWRDDDLAPFAAMGADPDVMAHMPALLSRDESDAMVGRIREHVARHGFGLWAVEAPGPAGFVGFVGLTIPRFDAPFMPAVEIGWRLARSAWGHGYAVEAARAALTQGFDQLGLGEVVSFTVPDNLRSRRVMERLDMRHCPAEDFDHPRVPVGHRLRRHVLYRITPDPLRAAAPFAATPPAAAPA